jgi:tRNA dimethylallyltransferase
LKIFNVSGTSIQCHFALKTEKTLVVIVGPTASGKTALAISVAKALQTEIVSADSRQMYREMNVGTAKPSQEELSIVPHHFINNLSINEDFDAAQFGDAALLTIRQIFERNNYAILCGGSGLYVKAVCEGFDEIPEVRENIREELVSNFEQFGIGWLQDKMLELDPEYFAAIDQQNPHRLIRALEVKIGTGLSISAYQKKETRKHDFSIIRIGLELPREQLYQRIDDRMDAMIANGLFDEARRLYPYREKNALQTVGYQEIFDFIDGKFDYEEAVRLLKRNTRRYAKRQLTWFKRDPDTRWFQADQTSEILTLITQFK